MHFTKKFWQWYERNYTLNVGVASALFLLQVIHLVWLFAEVIWFKLFGVTLIHIHEAPRLILILVDYTEVPAIITTSFVYINELRKRMNWKSALYLIFLNSQWLHLFWITDEFVLEAFTGKTLLPVWLAWVAILIDYLELPVIIDTLKKFLVSVKEKRVARFLKEDLREI